MQATDARDYYSKCSRERQCTAANFWWNTNACVLATGNVLMGFPKQSDMVLGAVAHQQVFRDEL
ncbi:uncharacterized protein N7529_001009 [Penicillium soppii]|uniref:uncharacterized protein n=1 Tax=Penicillium soppii TaxID=69789 RepID=UPI002546E829|nr:uncharacterized protein N7529_001009 [Penicillium soppii]KAJ5882337.1 hypothetical protein N7529_001009 [Penicillium soppii]